MGAISHEQIRPRPYPISVSVYHAMAENGAFAPDARVELIEGEILEMSPIGSLHARCVNFLTEFLNNKLHGRFIVSTQNPIVLDDVSEPQPDIAILRYREDFYKDALPVASDVAMLIEVSDSTVEFDRSKKLPRYAGAGIAETWLVDLDSDRVEVHTQPNLGTYGMVKIYWRGQNVVSETLPELMLSTDLILG